jgi:hypothetical protein
MGGGELLSYWQPSVASHRSMKWGGKVDILDGILDHVLV